MPKLRHFDNLGTARFVTFNCYRRHGYALKRDDGSPAVWQRRCYDHNCRLPKVVMEKINYCHNNPVTRGLLKTPDDWPWSSSRWYSGEGEVMLEIDGYGI